MGLIDTWKNRLIDVSARNPLLYFRFTTHDGKPKSHFVGLPELDGAEIDKLLQGKALKLTAQVRTHLDLPVHEKKAEPLPPEPEADTARIAYLETVADAEIPPETRPEDPWLGHLHDLQQHSGEWNLAQRNRVLYNLRNRDRNAEQEMGLNVLYLSYGFLKWRQRPEDPFAYSPLFLIPMDLDKQGTLQPQYSLMLDEDENVVFNPTLRLYLQQSFGLDLSALVEKYDEENPRSADLEAQLQLLREALSSRPDWEVLAPEPVLAIFHFANLILYKEMEAWGTEMEAHPLIARFCDHQPLQQPDFRPAREIDRQLPALDGLQVIDADGSQVEAIQAAKDGISFVLDGPPGTGKSQTIVNMIAALVAQGKKVLFVSQKKAALDVVYFRMAQVGLADLCLDLHDHHQSNKIFIEGLATAWQALEESQLHPPPTGLFERLERLKKQLNSYADQINQQPGNLPWTLHELYAQAASVSQSPVLNFHLHDPLSYNAQKLQDIAEVLQRLGRQEAVYRQTQTHPWRQLKRHEPFSQLGREAFEQRWQKLLQQTQTLLELADRWQHLSGLPPFEDLAQWQSGQPWRTLLQKVPDLPPSWLQQDPETLKEQLQADQQQCQKLSQAWSESLQYLRPEISARNLELIADGLTRFEKTGIWKAFLPAWYAFKKQLAQHFYAEEQAQYDLSRVRSDLTAYQELCAEREAWLKAEHPAAERFAGWETDWQTLGTDLSWLEHLCQLAPLNDTLKALLLNPEQQQHLLACAAEIDSTWQALQDSIKALNTDWPLSAETRLQELLQCAQTQQAAWDQLDAWIAYAGVRENLLQLGLKPFLEALLAQPLPPEQLEDAFMQRFYLLCIDAAEQNWPELRSFVAADQIQRIHDFSELDREAFALNRQRVMQAHLQTYRQHARQIPPDQISTLRKLAAQKRPRKRIRWLLKQLRNLILEIHPCWMMSPLSVAQFIELEKGQPTTLFDTVIFDEASQIYPEDGLCAIFRGKQLIVAGDPLQMPPTSVARAFMDPGESEDEDDIGADYESVLDLAATIMRRRRLMWHYRSRFEELINPSNTHIYSGDLITFPRAERPLQDPVRFHYVAEGVFHQRKNQPEAEAVVKRLIELFKAAQAQDEPLSVGIIAMGLGQQDCIRDAIQTMQLEDPSLERFFDEDGEHEPLFIKNLENVQGDERDIILLSVGYGKNPDGKFFQRFGPINQQVGHRRLNVAFTRARRQVEIFASFHYHEMKIRPTSSAGVRFLRDYLRFAETGHLDSSAQGQQALLPLSPIAETLTQRLLEAGHTVHNQLGASRYRLELAVVDPRDPRHYVLGIESDGPMYQLAQTARDRDRLRSQVLQHGGWELSRIWSRDWWQNPEALVQHTLTQIETLSLSYANESEKRAAAEAERRIQLQDTLWMIWRGGQYAVYRGDEEIHPPMMDKFDPECFGQNLFRFWNGTQVGVMSIEGEICLPAEYNFISAEALENGFYLLEQNGLVGMMNAQGQIILAPAFDSIEADFSPPFALTHKDGLYGFVRNSSGQVLHDPDFDWVGEWQISGAELGRGDKRWQLAPDGQIHALSEV